MKTKLFLKILLCLLPVLLITGCSAASLKQEEYAIQPDGSVLIGHHLTVKNTKEELALSETNNALAANGLYYATWVIGEPVDYENSDGDIVDLYDAQLYLLLGESGNVKDAENNIDSWLSAAGTNYNIEKETKLSANGLDYTLISYTCQETSPFEKGVSAFGIYQDCSVCIEFTCTEKYEGDLEEILLDFINCCTFH